MVWHSPTMKGTDDPFIRKTWIAFNQQKGLVKRLVILHLEKGWWYSPELSCIRHLRGQKLPRHLVQVAKVYTELSSSGGWLFPPPAEPEHLLLGMLLFRCPHNWQWSPSPDQAQNMHSTLPKVSKTLLTWCCSPHSSLNVLVQQPLLVNEMTPESIAEETPTYEKMKKYPPQNEREHITFGEKNQLWLSHTNPFENHGPAFPISQAFCEQVHLLSHILLLHKNYMEDWWKQGLLLLCQVDKEMVYCEMTKFGEETWGSSHYSFRTSCFKPS